MKYETPVLCKTLLFYLVKTIDNSEEAKEYENLLELRLSCFLRKNSNRFKNFSLVLSEGFIYGWSYVPNRYELRLAKKLRREPPWCYGVALPTWPHSLAFWPGLPGGNIPGTSWSPSPTSSLTEVPWQCMRIL